MRSSGPTPEIKEITREIRARRFSQRAIAGRSGRGVKRPAGVHRSPGARGGGGGHRRGVRGGRRSPEKALSDGANASRLDLLADFWRRLLAVDGAVKRVGGEDGGADSAVFVVPIGRGSNRQSAEFRARVLRS